MFRRTVLTLLLFNAVGAGIAYTPVADAKRLIEKQTYAVESYISYTVPNSISGDASGRSNCIAGRSNYSNIVYRLSKRYGVDWRLVTAVMAAESDFDPCAMSPKGAMGLMQLMPETAEMYQIESKDLYNPEQNIRAGVQHLKMLSERYNGDLELTVAAYNAGTGAVEKYGGIPPYVETQNYVKRVLGYHTDLKIGGMAGDHFIKMR